MLCPEDRPGRGLSSCVRLAGGSPAAVGTGAPRSRLQSTGEIPEARAEYRKPSGSHTGPTH